MPTNHDGGGDAQDAALQAAVRGARRGFRRDVQALIHALEEGELLVPLARSIADAQPDGVPLTDGLEMQPHLLIDPEDKLWCALFTSQELIEQAADELDWRTDGDAFEYVALPAEVALEMALRVIDEVEILGLVIDPLHDEELVLRRAELASLCSKKAIPLVGYVSQLPEQDFEKTLVAEDGDPPPRALTDALDACVDELGELRGWHLSRTFNPDRDLEPHLTLELVTNTADRRRLAERVFTKIEPTLPAPGYVDIVFRELPN